MLFSQIIPFSPLRNQIIQDQLHLQLNKDESYYEDSCFILGVYLYLNF